MIRSLTKVHILLIFPLKGHSSETEFCQTWPISCPFNQAFDNIMETTTVVEGGALNYRLGAAAP